MRLLFPILSLLLSGTLFFFVIQPMYATVSQMRTDVATYNTALDNSTYLQKTQDGLIGEYQNISQEDKERLEHFLPNTVNNIELILEIEQIANLYNMPIGDIRFDTPKAVEVKATKGGSVLMASDPIANRPYGVFSLEFTTEGTYNMFAGFIKDLEYNLRLVDVKSVSFSVPQVTKENPNPNSYVYTLKVDTYWLK